MKVVLIYRVKTECLESVKIEDLVMNPATEETETPCSYSNRSVTLPQATGKMSIGCLRKVVYICACLSCGHVCMCLFVSVSLTDGQETLTGLFALSIFWSLDQRAHHLTAMAVGGTLARTHRRLHMYAHSFYSHTCTFTHWHSVDIYTHTYCIQARMHKVTQTGAGTEKD